jgi:transposase
MSQHHLDTRRSTRSQSTTLFIGMDVHTDSIAVADVAPDHGAEVTSLGTVGTRQDDSDHLVRQMPSKATQLVVVYEAGPWGDWRARYLTQNGDDCCVVAPSRMPQKSGDRVTTDRRDAAQLARWRRAGALTAVSVPAIEDEAMRARSRAREDTSGDLKAATCRLQAFLLSHDLRDTGRATWTPAHLRWRSEVVCPTPAQPMVFQEAGRAVNEHTERRQRRAPALQEQVTSWRLHPVVEALQALRGGQFTVAVTTVAERGDLPRFATPRALMTCLGLVPAADATGARRRPGAMTTAGNTPARRALVEGAWAYRDPAKVSRHLQLRVEQRPNPLHDSRWKAQVRRWKRYRRLIARGKQANPVVVAMARELVGVMGAMAKQVPVTPEGR